jgi:iron complex transport system substrate-binding protein
MKTGHQKKGRKVFFTKWLTFTILLTLIVSLHSYSLEKPPKRIVSLSPSITEILYGIGAFNYIVGVTIYSDFPEEVKNLPKVGGWINPNIEAILLLKPDLVIMTVEQDRIFGNKIRGLGLDTLSVDGNRSIEDIITAIEKIGMALNKSLEAKKLIEDIIMGIEEVKRKTKNLTPKRVLFVIGRNPNTLEDIYAIGKPSFVNDMITIAGGRNVVENNGLAIKISKEAIVDLNPDVVIEVNHSGTKSDEFKKAWSQLKEISAVRNGKVYTVSSSALLHPSQRIIEGIRILTELLHPEVFKTHGENT